MAIDGTYSKFINDIKCAYSTREESMQHYVSIGNVLFSHKT